MFLTIAACAVLVGLFWGAFKDEFFFPTLGLAILTAIVAFVEWAAFLAFVTDWPTLLAAFGGFAVVGVFYSLYKAYSTARRDTIEQRRYNRRLAKRQHPDDLERQAAAIAEYDADIKPWRARDNKALILSWIAYWPFSLLVTLLDDPIRALFNWMYRRLRKTYDNIAATAQKSAMNVDLAEDDN